MAAAAPVSWGALSVLEVMVADCLSVPEPVPDEVVAPDAVVIGAPETETMAGVVPLPEFVAEGT